MQSCCCCWHCWVPPVSWPPLTALKQALFWMSHERVRAALAVVKVLPLTVKGRSAPAENSTAGAAPPRAPVKDWMLPEAPPWFWFPLLLFWLSLPALLLSLPALLLSLPALPLPAPPAATAASISSTVASSTKRFWVKMQPSVSLASLQVFPAAVGSPIWPGAKVPAKRASVGSPPTAAIWTARSRMVCLFLDASGEAGSWICVRAAISGLTALTVVQSLLASPTVRVFLSRVRKMSELTMPATSLLALALVKAWSATICCRQSRSAALTLSEASAAAALPKRAKTEDLISRGLLSWRSLSMARR
ncbi:hypothetical protein ACKVWC_011558 [Pyricularia oryzae]